MAKLFRKDVYLWPHGWYGKEGKLITFIKNIYFVLAKGTFLYGNYAKHVIKQYGLDGYKLYVIHNSLMFDEHLSLRKLLKETLLFEYHFNNTNKNLIIIGQLIDQKRLDILFEVLN